MKAVLRAASQIPIPDLFAATIGLVIGLLIAALATVPLTAMPEPFNRLLPAIAVLVFGYLGVTVMTMRQSDMVDWIRSRWTLGRKDYSEKEANQSPVALPMNNHQVLLDTSVIIDGRIADISRTGFVQGTLLVPHFVLNELQHIADSADVLRRNRGRRGLDMLNRLQKDSASPVEITDLDVPEVREVDDKLVMLAKKLHCSVITNDYNLNRVAELQGVHVLNINELANAVKTICMPGETMNIRIIQEGKELGQGVGYLDDGTMVVVEDGRRFLDRDTSVMVTKVLQTAAGRMIFARPDERER
jgi:uncharacterized protein YacL